jgi:hypothetical protein
MNFITISKQNIEDTIREVEGICKAKVVDWRLEISADVDGYAATVSMETEFVAVLEDGMNFTTNVNRYQE